MLELSTLWWKCLLILMFVEVLLFMKLKRSERIDVWYHLISISDFCGSNLSYYLPNGELNQLQNYLHQRTMCLRYYVELTKFYSLYILESLVQDSLLLVQFFFKIDFLPFLTILLKVFIEITFTLIKMNLNVAFWQLRQWFLLSRNNNFVWCDI